MIMCEYLELVKKINKEYRSLFIKLTKDEFKEWDNKTYSMMNYLIDIGKMKDINMDKNLKVLLFSEPCIWLIFINDEDFLIYIENLWESILDLLINNVDEIKHFTEVIAILNSKYPDRFPLNK